MTTVEEELDESMYWMELLIESEHAEKMKVEPLLHEADEMLAMTISSINTARRNKHP